MLCLNQVKFLHRHNLNNSIKYVFTIPKKLLNEKEKKRAFPGFNKYNIRKNIQLKISIINAYINRRQYFFF